MTDHKDQAIHHILRITKSDIDDDGFYIGSEDVSAFVGSIIIEANLGTVRFKGHVSATRSITAQAGSGIEAGYGIKAGFGIEAGYGIKAGEGIKAGYGIKAGEGIKAGYGIKAGLGIEAGSGIEAGYGIKAGFGIEAGYGIKAGLGIEAGFSITAEWVFSGLRIFAGTCLWSIPRSEEMEIRAELRGGVIAYGNHIDPEKSHD